MRRVLFFVAISCFFSVPAFCAPYWGKEFEFHQPDGSPIAVRVWGDEFYIRAETIDGYSLVRDPVSGFICYAKVNDEGSDFISTGIPYTGQTVEKLKYSGLWPLAQSKGIKKDLRLKHQAVIEKADRNRHLLGRDQRGRILPAPDSDAFSAASAQADSPAPLIGQVVGLTLLIQFPDVPATISQADIDNYCNQVGYTGYGNNGSVRDYFYDVSNGNLTYTNYVTVYYTAQYNRSYYTDPSISYGTRARELIQEALLWLDNPSGQNFNFGTISTDSSNYMLAINAFYAGTIQNSWAEGLWPHMSSMYGMFTSNEGVKAGVYQITNIGSSLTLGTFCHENGHMICDYPDLYDYGYESYGAGNYCLMASGGSDYNPIPPNPYLRDIKGWESVTVFPHLSGVQYFLQSNSNTSYKYLNPDNSHEFFYIDSRTKTGRNSSLPDDGLAIWHIDENGSNDYEQMTPSQHYMVSVEQADGLFHLEYGDNSGGSGDLFHAGYNDIFNDTTVPDAKWWNGNNSNLVIRQISAVGSTMSFVYDDSTVPYPPVAQTGSAGTLTNTPVSITLVATDDGLPNPSGALTYIITSLPSNGELSDPGNGIISSVPYSLVSFGNQVVYTPTTGYSGTDNFTFKANDGGTPPEGGDSNIAAVSISVIDAIYMANMDTNPGWTLDSLWQWGTPTGSGGQYGEPDPTAGYTGDNVVGYNLLGDYENSIASTRWAKTPPINCTNRTGVTLTFYRWLNVEQPTYDHAYIQVSNNGSIWSTIWENPSEITDSSWTLQTFDVSAIADNQPTVYIRWGMGPTDSSWQYSGWNIDDVKVTGIVPNDNIDIGLRVYDGTEIVAIACEPEGTLTSPLRIAKNGVVYGIVLVEPSDPAASKLKIQTSSGTKALRKF
jgi:M6 family metalloprotease-like protein